MQLTNHQMAQCGEAWLEHCIKSADLTEEYATAKAAVDAARAEIDKQETQGDFMNALNEVSRLVNAVHHVTAQTDYADLEKWRNFREGWVVGLDAMKATS